MTLHELYIEKVMSWNRNIMRGYIMGLCRVLGLKNSFGKQILLLFTRTMAWYIQYNMSSQASQIEKDTTIFIQDFNKVLNFFSRQLAENVIREIKDQKGKIARCIVSQGIISKSVLKDGNMLEYFEAEELITSNTRRIVSEIFTDFLKRVGNATLPEPGSISAHLLRKIGVKNISVDKETKTWAEWTVNNLCDASYNTGFIPKKLLSYGCDESQLTTRSCVRFSERLISTTYKEVNGFMTTIKGYHEDWLLKAKNEGTDIPFDYVSCMLIFFLIPVILSIITKTSELAFKGIVKTSRGVYKISKKAYKSLSRSRTKR